MMKEVLDREFKRLILDINSFKFLNNKNIQFEHIYFNILGY